MPRKKVEDTSRFPIFQERLRELQGSMNNVKFSEFLGMSRQTVGFYLNGDRIPDILGLVNIAQKCNVSADWILGLTDVQFSDIDIRRICEYTGLQESTAELLHNCLASDDQHILKQTVISVINDAFSAVCNESD